MKGEKIMCIKASEYNCSKCKRRNTFKCSLLEMAQAILKNK